MRKNIFMLIGITILISISACKKLIEVPSPKNLLTTDKVFSDSTSLKAALHNIYVVLERQQYVSSNKYMAVYADEALSSNLQEWNLSRIPTSEATNRANWANLYAVIYQANMILEQLSLPNTIAESFSNQVRGEALFLRAYAYFYLVNLFDRVPLITQTNVELNRNALQSSAALCYRQIIEDLTLARTLVATPYIEASRQRVNKAGVTSLLAKTYLFCKEWALAESLATELINDSKLFALETLARVFAPNSRETILQLGTQNGSLAETSGIVPTTTTTIPAYFFTSDFLNSFEIDDQRKSLWIGTNTVIANGVTTIYKYPLKYKNRAANNSSPENLVVLRIAEQYLIRAEAKAQQNKLIGVGGAINDLNIIRTRAGLTPFSSDNKEDLLKAIADERRHELFFENSTRFFDLKRTGTLMIVMGKLKPTWQNYCVNLPIPLTEITTNRNLFQNEGY